MTKLEFPIALRIAFPSVSEMAVEDFRGTTGDPTPAATTATKAETNI
jgi:hypothetical protein